MGDTINWGIFKRRFWGELLRHQQSARGKKKTAQERRKLRRLPNPVDPSVQ